jgi:hypothetical protein
MNKIAAITGSHGSDAQEMNRCALELAEAMPAISQEAERNASAASSLSHAIGEITSSAAGVVEAADAAFASLQAAKPRQCRICNRRSSRREQTRPVKLGSR